MTNRTRSLLSVLMGLLTLFVIPNVALAEDEQPAVNPLAPAETVPPKPIGLTIDGGIVSIYNFRGVNVLGATQHDQHFAFQPSLSYAVLDTGFTIGYWGSYQINGGNHADAVRIGSGHEADLLLGYSKDWFDKTLALSAGFAAQFYPFATKKDAGTKCPTYLEPSLKLSYSTALDLSLQVAYFAAVQKALKNFRYFYIRPYISKSVKLTKSISQLVGVGYGYKVFNDYKLMKNNVHDIAFDFETTIAVTDAFYLKPAIRGGWTNLKKVAIGDEFMIYGTFNLGYTF